MYTYIFRLGALSSLKNDSNDVIRGNLSLGLDTTNFERKLVVEEKKSQNM